MDSKVHFPTMHRKLASEATPRANVHTTVLTTSSSGVKCSNEMSIVIFEKIQSRWKQIFH